MNNRLGLVITSSIAFALAAGLGVQHTANAHPTVTYPTPAFAAASCGLAALVCANDSSPSCEIMCGGEQQAVCEEGSCSPAGNVVTQNHCSCK